LSLASSSTIDLSLSSSLSFDALGAIDGSGALSIVNWAYLASPTHAFRVLGDLSANALFLTLIGETTINGGAALFNFDGTWTNVAGAGPVPLPGAFVMLLSGLTALGALR